MSVLLRSADELRGDPTDKNKNSEDGPVVVFAVGDTGKVIADHDENDGNGHEGVLF